MNFLDYDHEMTAARVAARKSNEEARRQAEQQTLLPEAALISPLADMSLSEAFSPHALWQEFLRLIGRG